MAIKRNFILSSGIGISANDLYIVGSTASTSSSSGSLVVTGGAGIGRSLNIGGRAGIGTNLLNAALNVQIPSTATSALIIRGNTSQTSDAITYFSASGATQFAADANGRVRLTGMDGIWTSKVQQNIFDVSDGRVNWNLTTWQYSNIYWVTAQAAIGQAANQLIITNNGTTSITGVGVYATGWSTGGGNRVFGIVSPSGSERTYFNGYGNLVINPNNPNPLHDAWNQMHLLSMDISGTANTYIGNIILGRVEGTERFSVGPFGNTRITVGTATTATGLLVKAVASQSANIIETQASTGATNFYVSPTGGASFSDNVEIKAAKEVRFNNSGNTFYTGFKAGANASNTTYTLPIAFPGTGTSILQSDTSGTLSWVAMTSGGGSGTVNNGTLNSIPYYPAAGTAITGSSSFTNVGTGISITYTTPSTSSTTGALVVTGGVGIGGSLFANSIAADTGVFGLSLQRLSSGSFGAIYSTGVTPSTSNYSLATDGTNLNLNSTSNIYLNISNTNKVTLSTNNLSVGINVASTSTSTGALTVTGGVGIGGSLYVGSASSLSGVSLNAGSIGATSITNSTSATTGALTVTGGAGIGQSISVGGRLQMFNGANYTAFVSGATGNTTYTLPVASPGSGTSILQSTSAGVLSWIAPFSVGIAVSGASDGFVQFKSGSALGGTNSLFFDSTLLGLRVSGFPGGEATSGTSAALKVEQSVGSFNGNVNGTLIAANASTGFNGDLINLQLNGVTKFKVSASGAIGMSSDIVTTGVVSAGDLTNSTSTTTGALKVSGGAGITGNLFAGGNVRVNSSTASTSTATGALTVQGGLGVSGQLSMVSAALGFTGVQVNPSMAFIGNTSSAPITLTVLTDNSLSWEGTSGQLFAIDNNLTTGDIFSVSDISGLPIINASAGQTVTINEFGGYTQIGGGTINSASTTTGSLVIAGGLGMSGNAFIGGTTTITNGTNSSNTGSGALVVNGGLGVTGNANIGGTVRITNTTASTGNTSGALVVSGGAGIGQSLFIGGNLNLTGTLFSGTNTFTKNLGLGDISLDNGTSDTPSITFYWGNNKNLGIDTYWAGSGVTRFRITKELNETGGGELWSVDRNGIVTQTAWDVGEVINTRVYNNTDLNMSATTTINSTTYTNVATITYTPKSSTSHLWIEFDAHYDFSNGTTTDDFFSRITVGGSAIVEKNQIMVGQVGGGTRSGTIFPISGRYTNTGTSGIAITVQAKWGSADDNIRVYGSSTSGYMRIQEIGR